MQKMFVEGKEAPPIAHNLPPIAGALTWCRGLLERIKTPMTKIRKLDKSVMESEEARDVIKDYTAFQGQLSDFEREQIEAWGAEVEKSSQAKLKNPLLRSEVDVEFGYPLLYVNFDPLLVRLLREVKYFLLLGFEAPTAALEIYGHAEIFRRHMGNLDLVVNVYNWMQSEMLPVERPLLSKQLELLDDVLARGIAPHKVSTQSFTSIRVYRSAVAGPSSRDAVDATPHTNLDVPAGLARGRPARRPDAKEEEEEEVQEEAFKLEEQQHRFVRHREHDGRERD